MFSKSGLSLLSVILLATSEGVLARERWLERDGRAVFLYPRRFGQEQPAVLNKLREACPGQFCGTLAGEAVTPLLAAQPECSQQDLADKIIDTSRQFDAATQANMIAIAQEYRQAEKNTPPDFNSNPPVARNSVFCQKAPRNPELNGLVQAQDPANDPDLFFDPALKATVRKGTQKNTFPFGEAPEAPVVEAPAATEAPAAEVPVESVPVTDGAEECTADVVVTVTVTGSGAEATNTDAVTVTAGEPAATVAPVAPAGADFGSCTVPEIEFAAGFDGRKETSFQPKDKVSFNHGSAQNINIITRAICDTLVNSCDANQAAQDICATALAAAAAATPAKTGIQADAFNAVFGITTNFAAVTAIDDQGRVVPGTGSDNTAAAPANTPASTTAAAPAVTSAAAPAQDNTGGSAIGDFGSCTVPEIEFAAGFDGRKETSFQPKDKASFNHGSAQNINIITQFICDTLVNSCGADQQARTTCDGARAAASAAAVGTGAQADAFNAAFQISTNFAAVDQIDNQGNVVGGATVAQPVQNNAGSNNDNAGSNNNNAGNNNNNAGSNNNNAGNNINNNAGQAQAGNLQTFDGNLGGVQAPAVTALGNGQFQVAGNAAFNNQRNAIVRSCDVQNNQCANAANASGNQDGFNVTACNAQQAQCIANAGN